MTKVGPEGLETLPKAPGETALSDSGGAISGALDADLLRLVAIWPELTDAEKAEIRAIVDAASNAK